MRSFEDILEELILLEMMEASDDFYFEFGTTLKKELEAWLPDYAVKNIRKVAGRMYAELTDEEEVDVPWDE